MEFILPTSAIYMVRELFDMNKGLITFIWFCSYSYISSCSIGPKRWLKETKVLVFGAF